MCKREAIDAPVPVDPPPALAPPGAAWRLAAAVGSGIRVGVLINLRPAPPTVAPSTSISDPTRAAAPAAGTEAAAPAPAPPAAAAPAREEERAAATTSVSADQKAQHTTCVSSSAAGTGHMESEPGAGEGGDGAAVHGAQRARQPSPRGALRRSIHRDAARLCADGGTGRPSGSHSHTS